MIVEGTPQMIPALSQIWAACFGDSPDYIRFFMEKRFPTCQCFVWLEREHPVGAAYLLPCTLGERPAYYGYAISVHPEFQSRGFCGEILRAAEDFCEQKDAVFFVSPRPGVEEYYRKRGFYPGFFHRIHRIVPTGVPVSGVKISQAGPKEYLALRDTFFQGSGYVAWDIGAVTYALEELRLCGGFAHVLYWLGKQYLLFGTKQKGILSVKETTIPSEILDRLASALCILYDVSELIVEYPADSFEDSTPRGCCWNFTLDVPGWLGFDLT